MKRLDLARLGSRGYLSGFPVSLSWSNGGEPAGSIGLQAKSDGVRLFYRARRDDGDWYEVDEIIPPAWTPTQFGAAASGSSASNAVEDAGSSTAGGASGVETAIV